MVTLVCVVGWSNFIEMSIKLEWENKIALIDINYKVNKRNFPTMARSSGWIEELKQM